MTNDKSTIRIELKLTVESACRLQKFLNDRFPDIFSTRPKPPKHMPGYMSPFHHTLIPILYEDNLDTVDDMVTQPEDLIEFMEDSGRLHTIGEQ